MGMGKSEENILFNFGFINLIVHDKLFVPLWMDKFNSMYCPFGLYKKHQFVEEIISSQPIFLC